MFDYQNQNWINKSEIGTRFKNYISDDFFKKYATHPFYPAQVFAGVPISLTLVA